MKLTIPGVTILPKSSTSGSLLGSASICVSHLSSRGFPRPALAVEINFQQRLSKLTVMVSLEINRRWAVAPTPLDE